MHRTAAQLILVVSFLLFAFCVSASLTLPPPTDLEDVALESFAGSADLPQQLIWEDLESPETCPLAPVLAVLILPANTPYDDAGVVILVRWAP